MVTDDFKNLLNNFSKRPVPPIADRHVYLWHGELSALHALLSAGLSTTLDLFDMTRSLQRTPFSVDEARRVLQTAIQSWLNQNAPWSGTQQVVVVTGTALLARYRVPINAFFSSAGESRMFVFVVPRHEPALQPRSSLPVYVVFNPQGTLEYLQTKLGDQATIGV